MNKYILLFLFIGYSSLTSFVRPRFMIIPSFNQSIIEDEYDDYGHPLEVNSPSLNCSQSFIEDSGELVSPNYPNGYPDQITCEWNITVSPNMSVMLMFSDLELRYSDRIYVYDGAHDSHRLLHRHSKYDPNVNSISSGNQMFVKFESHKHYYIQTGKAFTLKYEAIKNGCGLNFNQTEGIIVSPGYPDNYPMNVKCEWSIHTEPDKNIIIMFEEFDLGADHDTLDIGFFKSLSGTSIPTNFISETSYLKLEFRADSYQTGSKFKLKYKTKYWAENLEFLIFASNAIIKTNNSETKTVAINGHKISKLTEYNIRKEQFIWFEPLSQLVYIIFSNNTKTFTLNGRPNSIALDYNRDIIYWIDIQSKTMKVMDINDENKIIYEVCELTNENPRDLIINAKKLVLVWSDVGFEPKIMYSNMECSEQNILYSSSRQAFHLTVDYDREKYYFIDISDHSLHSIDFEGKKQTFYFKSNQYFDAINAMTVLNNDLYLANDYMIYRLPEIDLRVENAQVLYTTQRYITGVNHINRAVTINRQWINSFRLNDQKLQPIINHSLCAVNQCEYLCISSENSFKCLSPYISQNFTQMAFIGPNNSVTENNSVDRLSIINSLLILLLIVLNSLMGYILFRFVYKTKSYKKFSDETRLPLEGIDNEVLNPGHSKSREHLLDFENNSTV